MAINCAAERPRHSCAGRIDQSSHKHANAFCGGEGRAEPDVAQVNSDRRRWYGSPILPDWTVCNGSLWSVPFQAELWRSSLDRSRRGPPLAPFRNTASTYALSLRLCLAADRRRSAPKTGRHRSRSRHRRSSVVKPGNRCFREYTQAPEYLVLPRPRRRGYAQARYITNIRRILPG